MFLLDFDIAKEKTKVKDTSTTGLLAIFAIVRSLSAIITFPLHDLFYNAHYPITTFLFWTLLPAALVFLVAHKPWSRELTGKHWFVVSVYGIVLALNLVFWCFAVKYYGPLRTLLSSQYADAVMFFIIASMFNSKTQTPAVIRGAFIALAGQVLLYFFTNSHTITVSDQHWQLGVWTISDTTIGGVSLFIAVLLTALRKRMARKLHGMFGSSKRMFSLGLVTAAMALFPFAMYQSITSATVSQVSFFHKLVLTGVTSAVLIAADYHVDFMAAVQLKTPLRVSVSLGATFAAGFVMNLIWGFGFSFSALLVFGMFLFAFQTLFREHNLLGSDAPLLPTGSSSALSFGSPSFSRGAKLVLKTIWDSADSRKIFLFLMVNLSFMFVELVYGFWTNSLGLISDAFHMLFDCTALGIGLYASVIAKWEPNQVFTYGYVNRIFFY
jgi:zinc transporter 5/7